MPTAAGQEPPAAPYRPHIFTDQSMRMGCLVYRCDNPTQNITRRWVFPPAFLPTEAMARRDCQKLGQPNAAEVAQASTMGAPTLRNSSAWAAGSAGLPTRSSQP